MNSWLKIFLLIVLSSQIVKGQEITGTVRDRTSYLKLKNVDVINKNSGVQTRTDVNGDFKIAATTNQVLIFYQPGYNRDTLFLTNMDPVKRYLLPDKYTLETVKIERSAFNPEVEYKDVYLKAKSFNLSQNQPLTFFPSRHFKKEGKYARRFKRQLEKEKIERKIDARFNEAAVKTFTPLKERELDCFMVLYRPTLSALNKLDEEGMKFYIIDNYKAFKALPADKRVLPALMQVK